VQLSIIIPVYNGASGIEGTVASLMRHCREKSYDYEVIVVDDGSIDGTDIKLKELKDTYSELCVLRNPGNRGKGYSVRRGFQQSHGEQVIYMDADLPYGVQAIDVLVGTLSNGADVVIGSRVLPDSRYHVHPRHFPYIFMRHILGRLLLFGVNRLFKLHVSDTQCGLKGCRRGAAAHLESKLTIDRFSFDIELLHLARQAGFVIAEIPVEYDYSGTMTTVRILRDCWSIGKDLLKIKLAEIQGKYRCKAN